jgi:tetratricopeptide (TPR) repeat protein
VSRGCRKTRTGASSEEPSQIKRDSGHADAARPLYEEAVAIYREEGGPLDLAHTIRHLGDVHRHEGHAKLAEDCYLEALALYRGRQETPSLDLANAIRPLALLKDDAGEFEEARRLWEEARELYAGVNVEAGVAESSARLARIDKNRRSDVVKQSAVNPKYYLLGLSTDTASANKPGYLAAFSVSTRPCGGNFWNRSAS